MIRNSRMLPTWQETKPTTLSIAARSTASLYRSESIGDLYRLYVNALDDGMDYNLAYIPGEFDVKENEPFDREYMRQLFALGKQLGKAGYEWLKEPPEIIAPK